MAANAQTKPRSAFLDVAAGALSMARDNMVEHVAELGRQCQARVDQLKSDLAKLDALKGQVSQDQAAQAQAAGAVAEDQQAAAAAQADATAAGQ